MDIFRPTCSRSPLALCLAAGLTVPAAMADQPSPTPTATVSPAPTPRDWQHDYTPPEFRQLAAARQKIDPEHLDESLLAAAIFQATNQQRADLKLPAFLPNEKAATAALLHSEWMAAHHALSHDEPSGHGAPATVRDRLAWQDLRPHAIAENIAYNFTIDLAPGKPFYVRSESGRNVFSYQPGSPALPVYTYDEFARTIVDQWMHSPLHRANIVDPTLHFLGVGAALAHQPGHPDTVYATQDFYTPSAPAAAVNTGYGGATLLPTPAQ